MAEKKPFSISDYLDPADVSKSDTAPIVELLDIDLIDANEQNFYELSDLQALANSIAMDGLQQPLVVMTSPDNPERVTILSGHRRRAAIQMLIDDPDEPRTDLRQVPCIRRSYSNPAMAELQLILANSTSRVLTSAEVMRQAERTEMLLYKLKEDGFSFPGKMRDHVAAACNASASKLARLKVIRERLEPEFLAEFEANKLSEDAAYQIAKELTPELQKVVIAGRTTGKKKLGLDIPSNVVTNISRSISCLNESLPSECPSGGTCDAFDSMQRRITRFENSWDSGCNKCCLECWRLEGCKTACAAGKEKNKKVQEKRRKQDELNKKSREKEEQKIKQKNKEFALRLIAIAPDSEKRKKLSNISWQFQGNSVDSALAGNSTSYGFATPNIYDGLKIADAFGVSLDYIYGRTDNPQPALQMEVKK